MFAMEDQSRKLQMVSVGRLQVGIFADEIESLCDWQTPTPLPHATESIMGVVSIHGRILTVLNPRKLAGVGTASDANEDPGHLVALKGDEQLALAVDAIGKTLDEDRIELEPENSGSLIQSRFQHDGKHAIVIDVRELFVHAIQGRERRRRRF